MKLNKDKETEENAATIPGEELPLVSKKRKHSEDIENNQNLPSTSQEEKLKKTFSFESMLPAPPKKRKHNVEVDERQDLPSTSKEASPSTSTTKKQCTDVQIQTVSCDHILAKGMFPLLKSMTGQSIDADLLMARIVSILAKFPKNAMHVEKRWTAAGTKGMYAKLKATLTSEKNKHTFKADKFVTAQTAIRAYKAKNKKSLGKELPGLFPIYRTFRNDEKKKEIKTMHAGCLLLVPRPALDHRSLGKKVISPGKGAAIEGFYYEPLTKETEDWTDKKKGFPMALMPIFKAFGLKAIHVIRGPEVYQELTCQDLMCDFIYTVLVRGVPRWFEANEWFAVK